VSAKKTDISQIRKYLNGELDARAMHKLEREAQDDPFLMDAIAGYEFAETDQQPDLTELESRLQQRIDQHKTRRMIPWKYISAAASLVVILGIAYLLWPGAKSPVLKQEQLAAKTQPPVDHKISKPDTTPKLTADNTVAAVSPQVIKKSRQAVITNANPALNTGNANDIRIEEPVGNSDTKAVVEEAAPVAKNLPADVREKAQATDNYGDKAARSAMLKPKKDTTALKEVTIAGHQTFAKREVASSVTTITNQPLKSKVDGVEVTTPNKVSGRVLDELGLPLPGASVQVVGTQKGTVTDANGRFSIPTSGNATLSINSIGFESKRVAAKGNDSLNIKLKENSHSLAEVVIGYGQYKPQKPIKEAHPRMGWDSYNKYLKRKVVAADGKEGVVRLSFIVGEKGALSDFKVIKGLSDETNRQAIDLVKEGPPWEADVSGKPKTVKLKIHFSKE